MKIELSVSATEKVFQWCDFTGVKDSLRNQPGVYAVYNIKEEVLYVGMSKDLATRLSQHVRSAGGKDLNEAHYCRVYLTADASTADILETHLINTLKPKLNFGKATYSEFVRDAEEKLMHVEVMIDELIEELEDLCTCLHENHYKTDDGAVPDLGEELYLVREIKRKERYLRTLRLRAGVYRRRGGIATGDNTGDTESKYSRFARLYPTIEKRVRMAEVSANE